MPPKPEYPARYYARLLEILAGGGLDMAAIIRRARINPGQLDAVDAMLRQDQVEALLLQIARASSREDFGLDLGCSLKPSSHSTLGYALLSSPTLDYMMRLLARYFPLITPTFRLRYRINGPRAELNCTAAIPMSRLSFRFHLETIIAAIHAEISELIQECLPRYDLYLSYPAPAHAARYDSVTEARCRFATDMPEAMRMVLPTALMERPLRMADSNSLRMAEARCSTLIRSVVTGSRVSDWVTMMLRESSEGLPTLRELAHTLNLSPRTLERYLLTEGHTFRELARDAFIRKAREMLSDGRSSVTQVGLDLGYDDVANFARAFRRESGSCPTEYRLEVSGHSMRHRK